MDKLLSTVEIVENILSNFKDTMSQAKSNPACIGMLHLVESVHVRKLESIIRRLKQEGESE